jgi:NhaP-type Na+/H+ or K+/H+ antiporter
LCVSVAIGLIIGSLGVLFLKHIRALTVSIVHEITFISIIMFIAYSLGDLAKASGVVSLIVVAVMMRTYGYYNLSPQGKLVVGQNIHVIAYFVEALVFVIIGLGFLTRNNDAWSW